MKTLNMKAGWTMSETVNSLDTEINKLRNDFTNDIADLSARIYLNDKKKERLIKRRAWRSIRKRGK